MTHQPADLIPRAEAVDVALDRRAAALAGHPVESVGLDAIGGRVLASSIAAEVDQPASDRATMDGFAFDASEAYPFDLREEAVFPEDEPPAIELGEAVEIATGAPLPRHANAVLRREDASVTDGELSGPAIDPGTYTYERGSNVSAGEVLFEAGSVLTPKDAILLGDLGRDAVPVRERFSVGVLATGSELHAGRQRDLDSEMLLGLVRAWGHEAAYEGTVPDEADVVRSTIADCADRHDVVMTTGGTSVGHADYVIDALADLGTVHYHRVRVRPGKPLAVATIDDGDTTAVAVPGKPLGAFVVTLLAVRPFFTGRRTLPTVEATAATDLGLGPSGFVYAVPVVLEDGTAQPLGQTGTALEVYDDQFDPSVLSASTRATRADGLVLTRDPLVAGETVEVVPLADVT